MTLADLVDVLARSAMASATVLLLVGAAVGFKTVVSLSHAPEILADFILSLSENPLILLFLINVLLFVVGMFLDAGPAIIILGPILGPIFTDLGVHPVHFAIIMSRQPDGGPRHAADGAGALRRVVGLAASGSRRSAARSCRSSRSRCW